MPIQSELLARLEPAATAYRKALYAYRSSERNEQDLNALRTAVGEITRVASEVRKFIMDSGVDGLSRAESATLKELVFIEDEGNKLAADQEPENLTWFMTAPGRDGLKKPNALEDLIMGLRREIGNVE